MYRIGVIHHRKEPPWSASELLKSIGKLGYEPVYIRIQDVDVGITSGRVRAWIHREELRVDGVIVRGLGLLFTHESFLRRIGVIRALEALMPVINNSNSILLARDKWTTLLTLAIKGLPVPDTYLSENPFTAMRLVETRGRIVYKPLTGSLGLGSTLLMDPDIAFQVSRTLLSHNQPLYLQEYIEKPGYDVRVFIVGDRVVAAMKRVINTNWKTNIARGARGVPLRREEDPESYELALKATSILGLDYSGVDIIVDKETGKHYIIEVNAFPIWKGLREATGVDPAPIIIKHLVDMIKK